ncbi:autotransporter domain-containing protein [Terasakiella pusilla]|jgi:uncharacterized protein YhjY with autotransporter beta-barrel domain|uniref:autotransporter domain-containing protein n=1 Tax=Terasakiella pusilla TaxID=64973 RepID=UPI003AA7B08A
MKKIVALAAVMIAAVHFAPTAANAAPCTSGSNSTTYSSCSGNSASASTTVTSSVTVGVATTATESLVFERLSNLNFGKDNISAKANGDDYKFSYSLDVDEEGKAAGDGQQKVGVWVNFSGSRFLFDKPDSKFDGNIFTGMVGVDYALTDRYRVGLGLGYEKTDIDTTFNEGHEEAQGWTAAPYVSYQYNDNYSVNLSAGFSKLDYDMDRKDQLDKNTITGSTDALRWFGALNFNGNWNNDNLVYGANVGTLFSHEDKDGFTEVGSGATTVGDDITEIGRVSIGGNVGYKFFDMMTPYVRAKYSYDYQDGGSDDESSVKTGLGVNFDYGSSVSAGVEANGTLKGDYKEAGGTVFLHINF